MAKRTPAKRISAKRIAAKSTPAKRAQPKPTQPKRKHLPALTPRAREIVQFVINAVALGLHDNEGEMGAVAKGVGMSAVRLPAVVAKLEEQGWLTVKSGFVYPTPAALRWQNPKLDDRQANKILRALH